MRVFLDAQGQLTLLSVVQYGQNSNISKILRVSSLSAGLKRIRSLATEKKVKAFMIALVTFKNGEDPLKNEGPRVAITFPPL